MPMTSLPNFSGLLVTTIIRVRLKKLKFCHDLIINLKKKHLLKIIAYSFTIVYYAGCQNHKVRGATVTATSHVRGPTILLLLITEN